ncbi:MAG: aldose 1-epimerase family protein [Lachnospiraceae bacterium]|nr:aldose 1-epimerase family protein [Lachnospiraceae bacterium]
MIYTIENEALKVQISDRGAELWSIQTRDGNEYLWQGDETYWADRAMNLFPYIARLTEGKYVLDGKTYEMTIHGFANYSTFSVAKQEKDHIVFELTDSEETGKMYPYAFAFRVDFSLGQNKLLVKYEVENRSDGVMYFGVGGHPGFNVPMEKGLKFEDYYLEFDKAENPVRVGFTETCFLNGEDKEYALSEGGKILMNHNLFDEDAIVLRDMAKSVTLKSDKSDRYVKVEYPEMDYLGIWHMPCTDAPYVCIEPWSSLPSRQDVIEDLAKKEDLIALEGGKVYENTWTIEIG